MPNQRNYNQGFTLLEVTIVMFIMTIILLLVGTMFTNGLKTYRKQSQIIQDLERGQTVMRSFERTSRSATLKDGTATSIIDTAQPSQLVFYRYFGTSAHPTKVRYFIQGSNRFAIGKTEYPYVAPETVQTISSNVQNPTNLFKFYDKNSAELAPPITQLDRIKMISLTVILDSNGPTKAPGPVTISTKVALRNGE